MAQDQISTLRRPLRELWFETGVVLLLGVVPNLFYAIASFYVDSNGTGGFIYQSLYTIVRSVGMIALILFIVSRSGESPAVFGFTRLRVIKDSAQGIGIFVAARFGYFFIWLSFVGVLGRDTASQLAHPDISRFAPPSGHLAIPLVAVAALTNGFAEELVCRAYLIPRFEQLFGSTLLAWLLSSLLFGSYHIYQGLGGFIIITVIGLMYGGIFCVTRRLWPIAFAHALQDFVALMMLGYG